MATSDYQDKSFEAFCEQFLKIVDKQNRVIPLRLNAIQKKLIGELTGRDIILKPRQTGITTLIQAFIFRSMLEENTRAVTLTHLDSSTENIRKIQDTFYQHFPFSDLKRGSNNQVTVTYPLFNSSHTTSTAGSLDFGRGGTFTIFHGSEVAFWKDPEKIISGVAQSSRWIILESTPNGAQGWFYEKCLEALSGRGGWRLHFFPWYEFEEYRDIPDFKERKLQELGRFFYQEYPETVEECFLSSGEGYFDTLDLSRTFTAPANNQFVYGHVYSAGLDFGQSNDFTFLTVIDRTENCQVDYLHLNKLPWSQQRHEIIKMYRKWHLTSIRAEENSIGNVNIEELENAGLRIERFTTTNRSKNQIMQRLYDALENGLKLIDWPVQKMELRNMVSKQTKSGLWTIEAASGHDDTVMGLALAVSAKINSERRARSWN
ncbi:terminase-like family [Anaerolinea thermolimosa]|uniref:phage terminase large subunit family protein n=1 Tax=Anaerolinea thermolimosa TaxID=229919 RepID=UPI0007808F15|nr:hypothetical protein [Anaerolinea thermolimosa]GAP07117.1 terminase-like family [Anaerolinea thermolimosa]